MRSARRTAGSGDAAPPLFNSDPNGGRSGRLRHGLNPPGVHPGEPLAAGPAAKLLLERGALESVATNGTGTMYQVGNLAPGEVHPTRPTPPLTANRLEKPGGDPGPDRSGAHLEPVHDLSDCDQDAIGTRIHGPTLCYAETQSRPFCYATSHNIAYVVY